MLNWISTSEHQQKHRLVTHIIQGMASLACNEWYDTPILTLSWNNYMNSTFSVTHALPSVVANVLSDWYCLLTPTFDLLIALCNKFSDPVNEAIIWPLNIAQYYKWSQLWMVFKTWVKRMCEFTKVNYWYHKIYPLLEWNIPKLFIQFRMLMSLLVVHVVTVI